MALSYRLRLSLLKHARRLTRFAWVRRLVAVWRRRGRPDGAALRAGDIRVALIRERAAGKNFVDVGAMWGVHGRFAFVAEEAGAREVVAVDVYPASDEFHAERQRRGSRVRFVEGDVSRPRVLEEIGPCEVVYCSGVLYHHPNPLELLQSLRSICRESLVLGTKTVPEVAGLENTAVFYPYLPERQRRIWRLDAGRQRAVTGPYEPESGYGNWFWGLSPSCVRSLLRCAGFDVEESFTRFFDSWFVCRVAPPRFEPTSGDWTSP